MATKKKAKERAVESTSGRNPTKPVCLVFQKGDKVTAKLVSPVQSETKEVTSNGPYAAMGIFRDMGYNFSSLKSKAPLWATKHIPESAKFLGYSEIISFPFV